MAGRPKRQNRQNVNITCNAEDVAVVNYVLRPVGVSMSAFLNDYLHSMAEAVRECGITENTFKDFTVGEIQQTFEKLQIVLSKKKSELAQLEQTVLPGLDKKA